MEPGATTNACNFLYIMYLFLFKVVQSNSNVSFKYIRAISLVVSMSVNFYMDGIMNSRNESRQLKLQVRTVYAVQYDYTRILLKSDKCKKQETEALVIKFL